MAGRRPASGRTVRAATAARAFGDGGRPRRGRFAAGRPGSSVPKPGSRMQQPSRSGTPRTPIPCSRSRAAHPWSRSWPARTRPSWPRGRGSANGAGV